MPFTNVLPSGVLVDYRNEIPEGVMCLRRDILVPISLERRYSNHIDWTVLQHSVAMYNYMLKYTDSVPLQVFALAHDFQEAIVRDVPTPVKKAVGESWFRVENAVATRLANYFGYPILSDLSPDEQSIFKEMDSFFADVEAGHFGLKHRIPNHGVTAEIIEVLAMSRDELIQGTINVLEAAEQLVVV